MHHGLVALPLLPAGLLVIKFILKIIKVILRAPRFLSAQVILTHIFLWKEFTVNSSQLTADLPVHLLTPLSTVDCQLLTTNYQILQSTSPPTPAFTASRPVITPRDVVRMLVPNPASTSGTSSRPK